MKANYHTHTYRCNHASGKEREYIENAIRAGMDTLGFSDHVPYPHMKARTRIQDDRSLPGYVRTLRALQESIRVKSVFYGYEAEYYRISFRICWTFWSNTAMTICCWGSTL